MAEIKSTLDIVMEKTKHLTLSEAEKQEQQKKEAKQKLSGLLQKYQDTVLNFDQLKDEFKELKATYDFLDDKELVRDVLNRIQLDQDNTPLLGVLDDIAHVNISALRELLAHYRDSVRLEQDKRSVQAKEKLARENHISGTAVLPCSETDTEWLENLQRIRSEYDQALSREKDTLLNRYM